MHGDINIFIPVTSILLQKLFPRRIKEGGGEIRFGIQRVSRRTKSWKYKRFSLALHKSHSRITLPHRRNSNGGFPTPDESNFPGRGWWRALNILSPQPGTFSAAKDPSVIPIGADQIMHNISRPEISPPPLSSWSLNWYFARVLMDKRNFAGLRRICRAKRDFFRYLCYSLNILIYLLYDGIEM